MSADPADDPPIEVALAPPANQPPPETAPQIEPASADDNESPGGAEEGTSAVTHDGVVWPGAGDTSSADNAIRDASAAATAASAAAAAAAAAVSSVVAWQNMAPGGGVQQQQTVNYGQPQYGQTYDQQNYQQLQQQQTQAQQQAEYDQQYGGGNIPLATAVLTPLGNQPQQTYPAAYPAPVTYSHMTMTTGAPGATAAPPPQYAPMGYTVPEMPTRKQPASGRAGGPRVQVKVPWTHEEDLKVLDGVSRYGQSWAKIARDLPESRTDDAVRNRWHRLMSKQRRHESLVAVSNGAPAEEVPAQEVEPEEEAEPEDDDGSSLPPKKRRAMKSNKASPKPRPRTENNCEAAGGAYLGAGSKNGDMWTPEEDNIIDMAVRMQGLTWKAIAKLLPGRTESGCRNRWVRNQEREFAAAGLAVHGAAAVFAALDAARQQEEQQAAMAS